MTRERLAGKRGLCAETTSRRANMVARATSFFLLGVFLACAGCETLENHKCCLFSDDGLFGSRSKSRVEKGTKKDEQEAIERASLGSSSRREAWDPTDEELQAAKKAGVDLNDYVWSTQSPSGGALFPTSWNAPGPALVVAPQTISAPVGTDVVVVASYIGEDSEYLRVGEKLSWSIAGVGRFMETNPNESGAGGLFTNEYQGCLFDCPLLKKTRKVDAETMTSTTSGTLYRINRGTKSTRDDVTILRGQSWASVSSSEEGASSVTVVSPTIASWEKRRATARINWVDAAFKYPESGVGMINTTTKLSTRIVRRTTSEPRQSWLVRYDVLGGDAALGPNRQKSLVVSTDANGEAAVSLSQTSGLAGTAKIKTTIIRPATESGEQTEIDSRSVFYTWTNSAPVTLSMHGPEQYVAGQEAQYQLIVNNLSDFAQRTVVELVLPDKNTRLVTCDTQWAQEAQDKSWIRWDLSGIPPRDKVLINFSARRDADPQNPNQNAKSPLVLNARIVSSIPLGLDGSSGAVGNRPQNASLGQEPPAESPSLDAASVRPSI